MENNVNPAIDINVVPQPAIDITVSGNPAVDVNLSMLPRSVHSYNELDDLPKLNGVTIQGSQTSNDLHLQDKLVSGTNIKTINGNTVLGAGDITTVVSVNSRTGDVVLTKADVGLENVDNTSDSQKPISMATQGALDTKQPTLVSGTNIKTVGGVDLLDMTSGTDVSLVDTAVKLGTELKTYYNIGKIQDASGTHPVVVGHAGDTLRQVFNNLMQMDEVQPTITAQPSISAFSLSSSASDEYGTEINSVNYAIATNQGSYTYEPSPTGVTWSKFTLSGGCASIDKTSLTGSVTLTNTYTVGTSSAVAFNCVGTHTAGGIAKTNLGNDSNPVVQIEAGTKSKTASFSKTSVLYPYYMTSNSETITTVGSTGRTKSTQAACTSSGVSVTAAENTYVYFLLPANYSQSKIQYEALGQWYDWSAGTAAVQVITITLDSGATKADYKAYRINSKMAAGATKFRIVNA